jgi:hypothetical protein
MIALYTYFFLLVWFFLGVRSDNRVTPSSVMWKILAMALSVVYTLAYIGFETVARVGVKRYGYSDFWFSAATFSGYAAITVWRRGK